MCGFAEYHFLSALHVVQQYDRANTSRIQIVADAGTRVSDAGKTVTGREVSRALSKQQRGQFEKGEIAEILSVLNQIEAMPGLFDAASDARQKSTTIRGRRDEIQARLLLNERKRSERRRRQRPA